MLASWPRKPGKPPTIRISTWRRRTSAELSPHRSKTPCCGTIRACCWLCATRTSRLKESFRAAISLAPTYAEPFAHLAALRAKQGYLRDAIRLMEPAVQHATGSAQYAERLEAYRALVECQGDTDQGPAPGSVPVTAPIEPNPEEGLSNSPPRAWTGPSWAA